MKKREMRGGEEGDKIIAEQKSKRISKKREGR